VSGINISVIGGLVAVMALAACQSSGNKQSTEAPATSTTAASSSSSETKDENDLDHVNR